MEVVQYIGGITSELWRDSFSILWGMDSLLWRLLSTVGDSFITVGENFSTVEVVPYSGG